MGQQPSQNRSALTDQMQRVPQAAQKAKRKLLAGLSAEELSTCRLSERLGWLFSAATEYTSKENLTAAFDEAEKVFPWPSIAYKPSGKTTRLAVLTMVVAAPLLLALMTAMAFGLCWAFSALATAMTSKANHSL